MLSGHDETEYCFALLSGSCSFLQAALILVILKAVMMSLITPPFAHVPFKTWSIQADSDCEIAILQTLQARIQRALFIQKIWAMKARVQAQTHVMFVIFCLKMRLLIVCWSLRWLPCWQLVILSTYKLIQIICEDPILKKLLSQNKSLTGLRLHVKMTDLGWGNGSWT